MVRNLTGLLGSVVRRGKDGGQAVTTRDICLVCDADLSVSGLYADYRVCHLCRFHYSMTARERIASLADSGTFRETNRSIISLDPLSFSSRVSYRDRLFRDQRRTGLTEAVVTGTCTVGGSPVMLVVLDFGFMGGTMGCVVGEKVALALEYSAKKGLPTVAVVTSGGARIQEGVLSLMQMAKTTVAATQTTAKGLPFISVLANPATGQAYASFANLADIVLAEPGAIIGYSPLRVFREGRDRGVGTESHTAETHLQHGLLDAVVDRTQLRDLLAVLVDLLGSRYRLTSVRRAQRPEIRQEPAVAWSSVQIARHESRPSSIDFIAGIFSNFVELHGDRSYGDDPAVVCGLGQLGGQTVMVIGEERGPRNPEGGPHEGRIAPEGFRKAQRALGLASKFGVPVITLIDTPGPNAGVEAEHRGLGNAIAATMARMAALDVPSISVVVGEAGAAGALALGVADRVLMLENATYSAVTPEDAAELIYQDDARAAEAAESLRLTARDCRELGIVDLVVPEPPGGAHTNPEEAARQLQRVLLEQLTELQSKSERRLVRDRYKKFRNIGEYSSHFRAAITREANALQGLVTTGVKRIVGRAKPNEEPYDVVPGNDDAG